MVKKGMYKEKENDDLVVAVKMLKGAYLHVCHEGTKEVLRQVARGRLPEVGCQGLVVQSPISANPVLTCCFRLCISA